MLTQPPNIGFLSRKTRAVNTALLSCTDTNGLPIFDIAHRVRLRIFENNQCHHQISARCFGNIFIHRGTIFKQRIICKVDFIASLFKRHAIHLLAFYGFGTIILIHLEHAISAFTLFLQNGQSLGSKTWCNHTVTHFAFNQKRSGFIANVGKGNKITITRHTISTAGTGISRSDGR